MHSSPQQSADGARVTWELRYLEAPDFAPPDDGHTNTTLWVTTNGFDPDEPPAPWVEIGVTKGFEGENLYTFYSAHFWWANSQWNYVHSRITRPAVLGRDVTFSIYWNTSLSKYTFTISDSGGTSSASYSGHTKPVSHYHTGAEFTCHEFAIVDRTYVSLNKYRKISDGSWVNVTVGFTGGSRHTSGLSGTGEEWCSPYTTFRFFVHSTIGQVGCY